NQIHVGCGDVTLEMSRGIALLVIYLCEPVAQVDPPRQAGKALIGQGLPAAGRCHHRQAAQTQEDGDTQAHHHNVPPANHQADTAFAAVWSGALTVTTIRRGLRRTPSASKRRTCSTSSSKSTRATPTLVSAAP